MKLDYLEYLIALNKAGSVNKSAALLHTSPQNVSRVMRQLEEELGCTLFVRTPYGIELTAAGTEAIHMAQDVLSRVDAFRQAYGTAAPADNLCGELTVVSTKIGSVSFMNDAVMQFSRAHPQVRIHYVEDDFMACLALLEQQPNSLGVLPVLADRTYSELPPGFNWQTISCDQICIIVSSTSPLGHYKSVTYKLLRASRFVIYARNRFEDGFWSKIIDRYIADARDLFIAGNGSLFYSKILDEGYIGMGCVKASAMSEMLRGSELRAQLSLIPIRSHATLYNQLVTSQKTPPSPLVQGFIDFLTNIRPAKG